MQTPIHTHDKTHVKTGMSFKHSAFGMLAAFMLLIGSSSVYASNASAYTSNSGAYASNSNSPALTADEESSGASVTTSTSTSTSTRIAILSDIHYLADELKSAQGRSSMAFSAQTEARLMEEIDAILDAALSGAANTLPDILLVCGDLLSNGEYIGAQALAKKLRASKELPGLTDTDIYVVNGNHDINDSYAVDFSGDSITLTRRVLPEDFSEIFSGLGYGEDDHVESGERIAYVPGSGDGSDSAADDPGAATSHGLLSYAADVSEDITLIVLDTGIYSYEDAENTMYGDAQVTAGGVSDDLLAWAKARAETAREQGRLVLVMSHHGMMPHYSTSEEKAAFYMDNFRIPNWEQVADTLADAGVAAFLTGHGHANDIAAHTSPNGNVIVDIETAALCAYPCAWRTLDIETVEGEDGQKSYTISVDTTFIDDEIKEQGTDTSSWAFTLGDTTKSFDEDYGQSLQAYAYEKTGVNETFLIRSMDYLLKSFLYKIVTHEDGLAGALQEALGLTRDGNTSDPTDEAVKETSDAADGETVGDLVAEALKKALEQVSGLSKELTFFGAKYKLSIDRLPEESGEEGVEKQEEKKEEKSEEEIQFSVELTYGDKRETGVLTINLGNIDEAVDELIEKAQKKLEAGDWLYDPYASSPLAKDLEEVMENTLIPTLQERAGEETGDGPLSPFHSAEENQDDIKKETKDSPLSPQHTPMEALNDAWQAFHRGDEGLADDITKEQREKDNAMLRSEVLAEKLRDRLQKEICRLGQKEQGENEGQTEEEALTEKEGQTENETQTDLETDDPYAYPFLAELTQQRLVGEDEERLITLTCDENASILPQLAGFLGVTRITTLQSLLSTLSICNTLGIDWLPMEPGAYLLTQLANLHETFMIDENVTEDSVWSRAWSEKEIS